jgi:hypothetical protein
VTRIVDRSGRVVRVVGAPEEDFNLSDVAFSSDGRLVATAEFNNRGGARQGLVDRRGGG